MFLAISPLIYFGKDSIIDTHDNLDIMLPIYKMLKEQHLLLAFDAPSTALNGLSTLYYTFVTIDVLTLLNLFFDVFTAHIIAYILKILLGYTSMYLFLKECVIKNSVDNINIIKLVSIAFAILPTVPAWWLAVESVPLLCYFFCKLATSDIKHNKKVWLLLFFPILSKFATTGIFLLSLWIFATIVLIIKDKKINLNLIYGFFALLIGYVIVDLKVFYVKFILKIPLNRDIYDMVLVNATYKTLSKTLKVVFKDFFQGSYHAPSLATILILTIFIAAVFLFLKNRKAYDSKKLFNFSSEFNFLIYSLSIALFFSLLAALRLNETVYLFFKQEMPLFYSFNWGRFSFLNRTILYSAFAVALVILKDYKVFKKNNVVYIIAILQIVNVLFLYNGAYNYAIHNLRYSRFIQRNHVLSYNEFFSEKLFAKIKSDLHYKGEKVAAVGYHPSILTYNGFATIDGYLNIYPLSYMIQFRKIIAPELNRNDKDRRYFDSWGGRLYLYNSELNHAPTRTKADKAIDLYINTKEFKSIGGKYILSRAEIKNHEDLDLVFINSYEDISSPYRIYVYSSEKSH